MPSCAVRGCTWETCWTLHCFPNPRSHLSRLVRWMKIIGGEISKMHPLDVYKSKRVCGKHFKPEFSNKCIPGRLSVFAEPTEFLPDKTFLEDHEYCQLKKTTKISNLLTNTSETGAEHQLVQSAYSARDLSTVILSDSIPESGQFVELRTSNHPNSTRNKTFERSFSPESEPYIVISTNEFEGQNSSKIASQTHSCNKTCEKSNEIIKSLKRENMNFRRRLRMKKFSMEESFKKLSKNLSTVQKTFIWLQIRLSRKKAKGRRFTIDESLIALLLMKESPKGYRLMQKMFTLPSTKTLTKMLKDLPKRSDITPKIEED